MLFGNSKKEKEQIEMLYNLLKDKANNFTKDDLILAITSEGYSKKIAKNVLKKFVKNKISFKEVVKPKKEDIVKNKTDDSKQKISESEKEKALKELGLAITKSKKEFKDKAKTKDKSKDNIVVDNKTKIQDSKKTDSKKDLTNISKKIKVKKVAKKKPFFITKLYFNLEDKYYENIDKINKSVKIVPFIDSIDKYFLVIYCF